MSKSAQISQSCALAFIISEILAFVIFGLQKVGQGHKSTIFAMTPFADKYQMLEKIQHIFHTSSHRFRDVNSLDAKLISAKLL